MNAPDVPDRSRTFHANQAVHMSDIVNLKMSMHRFGTDRPRFIKVLEPDGPSTDGGRQARQVILLTTEDDSAPMVVGYLDVVARKAELKSFPMVKASFESRFPTEIDISRGEYNRMLDLLKDALIPQELEVRMATPTRGPSVARPTHTPAPAPSGQVVPWIALAVAFGFGFATCYLLMRYQLLG
ncbi:MAG: hypothetical protein RIT81_11325 [Deltaproteobacteria bacterium]